MRRWMRVCFVVGIVLLFSAGYALAVKPGNDVNPNGFPNGEHYNLNIIGKKAGYQCQQPEPDPVTGEIDYGNVVFVPEYVGDSDTVEIHMKSGSAKGKAKDEITEFRVLDPCTNPFDGNKALLELPPNPYGSEKGYRVYARALAKPTDDPSMTVSPGLVMVQDEYGNDLFYLGLVTTTGYQSLSETFTRKKGRSRAVPVERLFMWSGSICYLDPASACDVTLFNGCYCCIDVDQDGVYDECNELAEGEICTDSTVEVAASCTEYIDEWVFNIAEFVTYMWDIEKNDGLKLLQIRFYPVKQ